MCIELGEVECGAINEIQERNIFVSFLWARFWSIWWFFQFQ